MAAIQEWGRRRSQYTSATKRLRYVTYSAFCVAVLLVLFGSAEIRWTGLWLFLGAALLTYIALQTFTLKYLRCPSCGRLPQVRGGAFHATVCSRCLNYLSEDALPNVR